MNGILKRYDFEPLAKDIAQYQNKKMAFIQLPCRAWIFRKTEHPMEDVGVDDLKAWFDKTLKVWLSFRYKDFRKL